MASTIDYTALGFTLTVDDAARALDTTPGQVHDLIRANLLTFLVRVDHTASVRKRTILLHPDELAAYLALRASGTGISSDKRNILRIEELLRRYLLDMEPAYDFDEAVERRAPLWASTKQGKALYIQVRSVIKFNERMGGLAVSVTTVENALEFLRALRKRGIIAMADSGEAAAQRWGTWWRVPPSLLPEGDDDEVVSEHLDGVREQGEPMESGRVLPRIDGDGEVTSAVPDVYLGGPPLGSDDAWVD